MALQEGDDPGFLQRIWRAWARSDTNAAPHGGGLTSEGAMKKVMRMIDEEKRENQPVKAEEEVPEAQQAPAQSEALLGPDYVATAQTMIEVEVDTTDQERTAESRKAQVSTLSKTYTTNVVISFVLLLLAVVLLRQTS